jgi:hypothetical protein
LRHNYAFQGKRSILTFGTYPDVSRKEARKKLIDAKRLLKEAKDLGISEKRRANGLLGSKPKHF